MSPEQQEMIERGAERIAGMNLGSPKLPIAPGISEEAYVAAIKDDARAARKLRSDAGKPRVKPAEAAPGALPEAARAHLDKLRLAITEKWRLAKIAESELQEAESEWYRYLDRLSTAGRDSITAK